MKREEARKVYEAAKAEGKTASLLDQERTNIFTQSVANIMPGETSRDRDQLCRDTQVRGRGLRVRISDDRRLRGTFRVRCKTRRRSHRRLPQRVPGHDISIEVNLNAGVPVEEIRSTSHAIDQINMAPSAAKITLKSEKDDPEQGFHSALRRDGKTHRGCGARTPRRPAAGFLR